MKILGLACFAGCMLIGFTVQAGDDASLKKEKAALQGVWKVLRRESNRGAEKNLDAVLEFSKDGKTVTFTEGGKALKATFKLNLTGKLKEIDITPVEEGATPNLGIYEFDQNKLKICLGIEDEGRPTEFASKKGKDQAFMTLERVK